MTKELRIQFDYLHGPIWKDIYNPVTREWSTGINIIDKDNALNILNDEAEREYSSLYKFDDYGIPHFDNAAYQDRKKTLLSKISEIIARANLINDGSFIINDLASEEVNYSDL